MTPEVTAVAPISVPTTKSEPAQAYMLPRLYWHGMLRGRA